MNLSSHYKISHPQQSEPFMKRLIQLILVFTCLTSVPVRAEGFTAAQIITIVEQAGDILLGYYGQDVGIDYKSDNSPVTKADITANVYITQALRALTPDIPIISEETAAHAALNDRFWMVDPMDGTKSFIRKTGEFTVNIALIDQNKPVFGVVHLPIKKVTYFTGLDHKAYKKHATDPPIITPIAVRTTPNKDLTLVASSLHRSAADDDFIANHNISAFKTMSSSIKFCLVAEGLADIYPRFGTTMEWDTAAGHAVLLAAGGHIIESESGVDLLYKKPEFRNPHFIAFGAIQGYPE
jgi:3'(2'), 5'-bisphosphate nucleotidase